MDKQAMVEGTPWPSFACSSFMFVPVLKRRILGPSKNGGDHTHPEAIKTKLNLEKSVVLVSWSVCVICISVLLMWNKTLQLCLTVLPFPSVFCSHLFSCQAQKELLDAELDFHKRLSSGEDTTELRKKLNQLQVEVSCCACSGSEFVSAGVWAPLTGAWLCSSPGCPFRHPACRPREGSGSAGPGPGPGPRGPRPGAAEPHGGGSPAQGPHRGRLRGRGEGWIVTALFCKCGLQIHTRFLYCCKIKLV